MTRIIYNNDIMKVMSLFEAVTQAKLKDCIFDVSEIANAHTQRVLTQSKQAISEHDQKHAPPFRAAVFDEKVIFIVEENQIGRAIGKNGVNVRRLEAALNKRIKIVEFSPDIIQFIKNLVYPVKVREVRDENGLVTIVGGDTKTRGILIGRDSRNLKETESIAKRYFPIQGIKVI